MKKLPEGFIKKEDLENLVKERVAELNLDYQVGDRGKVQLLLKARSLGLIDDKQFEASRETEFKTLKFNFKSLDINENVRKRIVSVIEAASVFYYRLMVSLNLFLLDEFKRESVDVDVLESQDISWRPVDDPETSRFTELHKVLFGTVAPAMLKHLYIHEKYSPKQLNNEVAAFLERHQNHIAHLSHPDWKTRMTASGWDRIAEAFSKTLKTNFELKIRSASAKAVKTYVAIIYKEQPLLRDAALKLLSEPWPKRQFNSELTAEAIQQITLLRDMLGLKKEDRLTDYPKFSEKMFQFYIRMWQLRIIPKLVSPLGDLCLKHCYFDHRILEAIFQDEVKAYKEKNGIVDEGFLTSLGLCMETFKQVERKRRQRIRRLARKTVRKETMAKHRNKRAKTNKEASPNSSMLSQTMKRWMRRGTFNLSCDWRSSSFSTDGVSITISMSRKKPLPEMTNDPPPKKTRTDVRRKKEEEEWMSRMRDADDQSGRQVAFVGVDPGRAKLYFAATLRPGYRGPKYHVYSKGHYLHDTKHKQRQRATKKKINANPELHTAHEMLEKANRIEDLIEYLRVQQERIPVLYSHNIQNKENAVMKLRVHSWKRSSLDRAANRLVDSGMLANGRLIIGMGNAKVTPGGKGETNVPTC